MTYDLSKQGPRIQPDKIDYVALWQYFETRGSELKGTMLQVLTLLIGFTAAILAYAVDKTLNFDASPFVHKPFLLLVLAVVGVAIVIYAEIVIQEFGEHINRNFDRADYSRLGDRPLDEILSYSESTAKSTQKPPSICITVRRITRCFGAAFALCVLFGLVKLICQQCAG
jgi:hypothetical protein